MTSKEQLMAELDQIPESLLEEGLMGFLKAKSDIEGRSAVWQVFQESKRDRKLLLEELLELMRSHQAKSDAEGHSAVWTAYQESKRDRAEVYRRLADS